MIMRNYLSASVAGAFALFSSAVPAAAFDKSQIGAWTISQSPESGICTAVTSSRETGAVLILMAPDGGNQGGFIFGGRGIAVSSGGETKLKLKVKGKMVKRQAFGIIEDGSQLYFIPFNVATEMNQFADSWVFEVANGAKKIISLPVKDFTGAKSLFDACTAERATFKRPT
jgi:hypothetical protein